MPLRGRPPPRCSPSRVFALRPRVATTPSIGRSGLSSGRASGSSVRSGVDATSWSTPSAQAMRQLVGYYALNPTQVVRHPRAPARVRGGHAPLHAGRPAPRWRRWPRAAGSPHRQRRQRTTLSPNGQRHATGRPRSTFPPLGNFLTLRRHPAPGGSSGYENFLSGSGGRRHQDRVCQETGTCSGFLTDPSPALPKAPEIARFRGASCVPGMTSCGQRG